MKRILLWIVMLATVLAPWTAFAFPYKTNAIVADADDAEAIANYESFQWSLSAWDDNILQWDFDIPVSNAVFRLLGMQDRLIYLDVVENSAITGTYHYTITTNEESFTVYRPAVVYTNTLRDSWIIQTNVYAGFAQPVIVLTNLFNSLSLAIVYVRASMTVDGEIITNASSIFIDPYATQAVTRTTIEYGTNINYLAATTIQYTATGSWTDIPAWGVYTQTWGAYTCGAVFVTNYIVRAGSLGATNVFAETNLFTGWTLDGTATNQGSMYYVVGGGTSAVTRIAENSTNSTLVVADSSFVQSAPPTAGVVRVSLIPWRPGAEYRVTASTVLNTTSYDGLTTGTFHYVLGFCSITGSVAMSDYFLVQGKNPLTRTGLVSAIFTAPATNYIDIEYGAIVYNPPNLPEESSATNLFVTLTNIVVQSTTPHTTSTVFGSVSGLDTNSYYRLRCVVTKTSISSPTSLTTSVSAGGYETNTSYIGMHDAVFSPGLSAMDIEIGFGAPGETWSSTTMYSVLIDSLRKYQPTATIVSATASNLVVYPESNKVVTTIAAYTRTNKLWSVSTSEYWRIKAYVPKEDLPPVQSYLAELLAYGSTWTGTPTRSLAKGKVNVTYSLYDETEGAAWTNPAIGTVIGPPVHTLTDPNGWPFVVSSGAGLVYSNEMGSGAIWSGTQWEFGMNTNAVDTTARAWIAAVSNTADTAHSTATGAAATADSAYTAATQAQATADSKLGDFSTLTGADVAAAGGVTGTVVRVEVDSVWTNDRAQGFTATGNIRFSNADSSYVPPTVEYYWNAGAPSYGVYSRPYFFGNLSYLVWSNSRTVATNKIWQSGNDGSGSGLDADLLDGKDSTAFATGTPLYVETYLGTGDFHSVIFSGGTTNTYLSGAGTVEDFTAAAGSADLSGLSNDVLAAWATGSNALTIAAAAWNATNYVAQSQIHIANLGTHTVTRASGAGAYIDLTNAAQAINFDADTVSTAGKFGWALDYKGTNALSLIVTNTGAVVQPTAISLTNGAGVILFVKPQGSQTIKAYQ